MECNHKDEASGQSNLKNMQDENDDANSSDSEYMITLISDSLIAQVT